MLGFAFACVSNIHIIIILYDVCLLPASFGYININYGIWNARFKEHLGVQLGK
jgi:hypothetical protein